MAKRTEPNTPARRRSSTATSNFGVSRREGHDASAFYARFEAPTFSDDDTVVASPVVDELFCADARTMTHLADNSVALVVTSPPYFAGKAYEEELGQGAIPASYVEYLDMLTDVFAECVRVLEPGGRIAVNVANLGRKPYRSLSADVITILQDRLGLVLRGEVIWQKSRGSTGNCAWGSFRKASNPVLRDVTERIVIASKGRPDRAVKEPQRAAAGLASLSTITKDEFLESTLDVWEFPAESARRVDHPAPYPVELPQRLIELYTFQGDVVLDPFMGSGTTAVAAVRTDRHYLGFDLDPAYVEIAEKRIAEARHHVDAVTHLANPTGAGLDELTEGVITAAGFVNVRSKVKRRGGLEYRFAATDPDGGEWLFDVVGGYTTGPNGLRRTELLWRALGRAAVAFAQDPSVRIVLSTSARPRPGTDQAAALADATADPQTCIVDGVIVPTEPDAVQQLIELRRRVSNGL